MRLTIALFALAMAGGVATTAEAGCIPCPDGYTYWHTQFACVPDNYGATGIPPKSTFVEPLDWWHAGHTHEDDGQYTMKKDFEKTVNSGGNR